MSLPTTFPKNPAAALRWRLWIDGCGGFLLLIGDQLSLGRADAVQPTLAKSDASGRQVDVGVFADWPRHAGTICRRAGDYFWTETSRATDAPESSAVLVSSGQTLGVDGTAKVQLQANSPLSSTAVLSIAPPHRFDEHVDGVVLVDQTIVIGNGRECHLRHREATDVAVMVFRSGQWSVKFGLGGHFQEMATGQPVSLGSITMTLEPA
ncbi:hypothetical protein Poly51_15090 [Rubripirellula tenax]|uniref:Uncharacterized protein n=1 Tax=Rubripirellula tenax TaxID=2528015 RepID=A0A5C6FGE0_9BACT|nr:hypothetical protein [Rubripirellula tenax]TWU58729.1 hypothetical protein Poly51_15090 [Rubripirellula tenax]